MNTLKTFSNYILFFTLLFCSIQVSAQNDSTVNNDELISPTELEVPGIKAILSGSSIYIASAGASVFGDFDVYYGNQKESLTMLFDPKTIALKVEFDEKQIRKIDPENSGVLLEGIIITTKPGGKTKQAPMYFDNSGYVYTGTKKDGYIKVPFQKLSKLMPSENILSGISGIPGLKYPDGSVTYYGMDVSPKKFPILEWVFVYKTQVFEGNDDFTKETMNCIAGSDCTKFTLKAGEGAGSYVLFDSKKRLREIHTKNQGFIIYTYEEVNVKLPDAKDMSAYF